MNLKNSLRSAYKGFSLLPKDHLTSNLPPFVVGVENGFLPRQDPLIQLPNDFKVLESLLQKMPITKKDGSAGLLAKGDFGAAVDGELPLYDVTKIDDKRLLTALFRDYTFAASAYLLEPCDILNRKRGDYGLGREKLPANLAVPLARVSEKLGAKPFMEYAQSYALYNYMRKDPKKGLEYSNLDLIRTFSGMPSEYGFILVHVAMVSHSGKQVKHTVGALEALSQGDRDAFNEELRGILNALKKINETMDTMWMHSTPGDYIKFRTFIMGTKNQPMFPKGVIYEGVSTEPTFFRGESGANDSIVPTADNFLQLTSQMPDNPLTQILRDFRTYRPANHNEWLAWLEKEASALDVRSFAQQDPKSAVLYLALLDQVREFRNRHWLFTKEYIIKYTSHPVATVTWLPNQLKVVLKAMVDTGKTIDLNKLSAEDQKLAKELIKRADAQHRMLVREVEELGQKFTGQYL